MVITFNCLYSLYARPLSKISEIILKEPLLHTYKEFRAEAAKEEKLNQGYYQNSVERQYKYAL